MEEIYQDHCLAFQLEGQDIKGRIIRLDKTVDRVLKRHKFPQEISRELGSLMALTALLGSMMKFDGILTTQIKGDKDINMLVSDYATDGKGSGVVRGTAQYNADKKSPPYEYGKGNLMITIDQGQNMDRYQGVVELMDNDLVKTAEEYFRTSEQLPSKLLLACARNEKGQWNAGAILIQHLASNTEGMQERVMADEKQQDDWQTANILLSSLRPDELLNPALSLQQILLRLFHEKGVRAFSSTKMVNGCRCSDAKLRTVLSGFTPKELKDIAEDGIISMTCEFCKTAHKFELNKLIN